MASKSQPTKQLIQLTATDVLRQFSRGELTVEKYAEALLQRIEAREDAVRAWAHLDREHVLGQARALDGIPPAERGPLHGIPVAVKDTIYTKDMPTQFNSPSYKDHFAQVDASCIMILRQAGALILGKTVTTEFGATSVGPRTRNPQDPTRTPGGTSSGSGAAVSDLHCPLALASGLRPASFTGIYAFKPTWGAVSREGCKLHSVNFDTLTFFSRGVDDLNLLANAFGLADDEIPSFSGVAGATFGFCRTELWGHAEEGTRRAMEAAREALLARGAVVEDVELGEEFANLLDWGQKLLHTDGQTTFRCEYKANRRNLDDYLVDQVENIYGFTKRQRLEAYDGIAAMRPRFDAVAARYAAVISPSVPGVAPPGHEHTGFARFHGFWNVSGQGTPGGGDLKAS